MKQVAAMLPNPDSRCRMPTPEAELVSLGCVVYLCLGEWQVMS